MQPRCSFREQPPPLLQAEWVEAGRLAEAVRESFYGGLDAPIALYPSLTDALAVLSERLGGLRPATPLPRAVARVAGGGGAAWLAASPAPDGSILDCDFACSHEPLVVYEGGRVALPSPTLLECDCLVYSVASLRDYGVGSSVAWVAGLEGGLSTESRIPGLLGLRRATVAVRRLRAKRLAAITAYERPVAVGPFAAFTRTRLPVAAEALDGARYGVEGAYAYSLYTEPGCYTRLGGL